MRDASTRTVVTNFIRDAAVCKLGIARNETSYEAPRLTPVVLSAFLLAGCMFASSSEYSESFSSKTIRTLWQ
jgi:hypothetical protein